MSSLELFLIALMVIGGLWQLILGIGAAALAVKGAKNIKVGMAPGLIAFVSFIIYLFVR